MVGSSIQGSVDDGYGFCPGNATLRRETSVGIPRQPMLRRGKAINSSAQWPLTSSKGFSVLGNFVRKTADDGRKLSSGNGFIGAESSLRVSVQNFCLVKGRHRSAKPLPLINIGKRLWSVVNWFLLSSVSKR